MVQLVYHVREIEVFLDIFNDFRSGQARDSIRPMILK